MKNRLTVTAKRMFTSRADVAFHIVLFALLAGGIFMRLYKLDTQSFWQDEFHQLKFSFYSPTVARMMEYTLIDVHPPLFNFLSYLWVKYFPFINPPNETAFRLLSALSACAGLVVLAYGTKNLMSRPARLVMIALAGFVFFPLEMSRQFRSYGMLMGASSFMYVYLLHVHNRLLQGRQIQASNWAVLFVAGLVLSYVHYFGTLFAYAGLAVLFVFVPSGQNAGKTRCNIGLVLAGLSVLFLPWLFYHYGHIADKTRGGFWIDQSAYLFLGDLSAMLFHQPEIIKHTQDGIYAKQVNTGALSPLGALLGFSVVCAVVFYKKLFGKINTVAAFSVCLLLVVLFSCGLISLHTPIVTKRNLLVIAMPLFAVVGMFLFPVTTDFNRKILARLVVVAVLLGANSVPLVQRFYTQRMPDHRAVARYITGFESCRDAKIFANAAVYTLSMFLFYPKSYFWVTRSTNINAHLGEVKKQSCPVAFISHEKHVYSPHVLNEYKTAKTKLAPLEPLEKQKFSQMFVLVRTDNVK